VFKFLRSKSPKPTSSPMVHFKDGEGFFEYQCKHGFTSIEKGTAVIALVLDAQKEFGTPVAIRVKQDGSQLAALRVASDDGGFTVFATTPSAKGEKLQPGDVVLWVPSVLSKELGEKFDDTRKAWVGLIRAKVKPELNPNNPAFTIKCRYD
jgi:hypothetical protein